jgi:hypothetical protein
MGSWDAIRRELIGMAEEDQRVRAELAADGSLFRGYHQRMREVHDAHAARLAEILDHHGWPGVTQVGQAGAQAAWLIAQHAIAQPAFQRRVLDLLKAAAKRGDVPLIEVAMLEDRICTFEGRPQLYGTQFDWDELGQMSPLPFDDPARLDARRREIGLEPLAEAVRKQRAAAAEDAERPPDDWAGRQREMESWCREVGWRE